MVHATQRRRRQDDGGVQVAGGRRLMRALLVVAASIWVAAVAGTATAKGAGQKSIQDGVYTEAQAESGAKHFEARCAACHQPDEFVGDVYMNTWANQPAHGLFELIRRTMPEDNPGSLPRQQYAEVLAYLFKLNGMPAGDEPLGATEAALKEVRIEGPFAKGSGARPGSGVSH